MKDGYLEFIKGYMKRKYKNIPDWIVNIMKVFNIKL